MSSRTYLNAVLKQPTRVRVTGKRPWPAIPAPTTTPQSLQASVEALMIRSQVQSREKGDILDSVITVRDLIALGIIDAEGVKL